MDAQARMCQSELSRSMYAKLILGKSVAADKICERVAGGKDSNGCPKCDTARVKCPEPKCNDPCNAS